LIFGVSRTSLALGIIHPQLEPLCPWRVFRWDVNAGENDEYCLDGYASSRRIDFANLAPATSSDEMLIKRIARGDQLAMQSLFARHQTRLYRWLLRHVRDEALTEDLLSDVFFDVWQKTASFEGRSSVST
jgi:hypothetical protein